jgi:transposase
MEFPTSSPRDWVEWRRKRALELKQQGWKQRTIAAALGVTEGAVSQWLAAARRGGPDALSARTHLRGSSPRLTPDQLRLLPEFLWHGPEAYGLQGQQWTSKRIAAIIREEFGVSYSSSQVSRLLKQLGWSPRSSVTRALYRDEAAIESWRLETWPGLKETALRDNRTIVFVDESTYDLPSSVNKVENRGRESRLPDEWLTGSQLSVLGGVTPQGDLYSLVRPGPLCGSVCLAFLSHLLEVADERLLVIWDRSPIHRRPEVKEFLSGEGREKILVELLPAYAPDLNPMGWLWRHLRQDSIHHQGCANLEELQMELNLALTRLRRRYRLIRGCFAKAKLEI